MTRFFSAVTSCLAVVSVTAFIVTMFWGGIRIHFPIGVFSLTDPLRPLFLTLLFTAIYTALNKRLINTDDSRKPEPESARVGLGGWIICATALLTILFIYRAYKPQLMGGEISMAYLAVLPVVTLGAGLGAYRVYCFSRNAKTRRSAWFSIIIWAISPLAFPAEPETAAAFWVMALWFPTSPDSKSVLFNSRKKTWGLVAIAAIVIAACLATWGDGWAFGRLRDVAADRLLPASWLVVALIGLVLLFKSSSPYQNVIHRTGYLALLGVAIGGTRGNTGIAGAMLLLPFVLVLMSEFIRRVDQRLSGPAFILARNIFVLCFVGLVLGFIQHNMNRDLRVYEQPAAIGEES